MKKLENQKGLEKEEKQSKNIVKKIMEPHYLSRKDRHTIGTTSEPSSESDQINLRRMNLILPQIQNHLLK